jgi:hypothetical protein
MRMVEDAKMMTLRMAVVALSPHTIAEMIVEDVKMMSQLSGRIAQMTLRMAVVALSPQRIAMIGKTTIVDEGMTPRSSIFAYLVPAKEEARSKDTRSP